VPVHTISTKTADHYKWGGDLGTSCDGWHLVKTSNLSVIEELMSPDTSKLRHYHLHAQQFFYVLDGVLTLEIEEQTFVLQAGEGIEISPRQRHQAFNRSLASVRFLVTSQPPSHGDRINE
jgi:mannose-6-phosphate isomerase-like protein (cupin superfamily)